MAELRIAEQSPTQLDEYASIPIAFEVRATLDLQIVARGLGGFGLRERCLEHPYVKDYDQPAKSGPASWGRRWDLSNWGVLAAFDGDRRVGGCVIAHDTPGVEMLEGRRDLAVLWDIRVHPDRRRGGIGARLFAATEAWAKARGCTVLKVETQNINLPACRFYAKQGCLLGRIHRFAYRDFPDEVELVWYKQL
jgi:GNAT superfamily N-acetyltransferase